MTPRNRRSLTIEASLRHDAKARLRRSAMATAALMAVILSIVVGCGSEKADKPQRTNDVGVGPELAGTLTDAQARSTAGTVNQLGFDVHRKLLQPGGNTVTSPVSLGALLALLAPGAEGQAA
jgi:hypothetical protein